MTPAQKRTLLLAITVELHSTLAELSWRVAQAQAPSGRATPISIHRDAVERAARYGQEWAKVRRLTVLDEGDLEAVFADAVAYVAEHRAQMSELTA